jgi:hypothetical protein
MIVAKIMYQQFPFIFRCNIFSRHRNNLLIYGILGLKKARHGTQHTITMSKFLESKDLHTVFNNHI